MPGYIQKEVIGLSPKHCLGLLILARLKARAKATAPKQIESCSKANYEIFLTLNAAKRVKTSYLAKTPLFEVILIDPRSHLRRIERFLKTVFLLNELDNFVDVSTVESIFLSQTHAKFFKRHI